MTHKLNIIILAAGKGTRMKSKKLKVLHPFSGSTIIEHILHSSYQLNPNKVIMVYGHQGQQLKKHLSNENIHWVEQVNPNGTGHAVQCALPLLDTDAKCLVLVGDVPLIDANDLKQLINHTSAVLTAKVTHPFGYGRIIKNSDGSIQAIIEEKDANPAQKQVDEINSGIIMTTVANINKWLGKINTNNAQGELYLTDIVALANKEGESFQAVRAADARSINGINDRVQLAKNEGLKQDMLRENLMLQGVSMRDPKSVQIRGFVDCGEDISIDAGVILEGENTLADDVTIGAYSIIKNSKLGKGTRIAPHSMLDTVITEGDCDIGPYARLRPGTHIGLKAKVGNFVETKKTTIGYNSKASHLTYLGDCEVGDNVNIGAGTITCNYDGVNKFKTTIEDDVFIGSDTQLIAPVTIGKGATIGAGSTITKNTETGKLTLSRSQQKTIDGWKKPTKSIDN